MSNHSYHRVGIIGVGGRGLQLAQLWNQIPGAKVVAVADLSPERLDIAARELGEVARYGHHRDMLQSEGLDVVTVATLGLHHREPTVDAAAAGVKGIYVEKPMATSLADCDAMIAACRASGTKLSIGHQRRWHRYYAVARDALKSGAIGKVVNGYVTWSSGRVGSCGTHFFDALNMVLDDEVEWVSARLDPTSKPQPKWPDILDPAGMGFLTYRSGVRVAVDAMENTRSSYDLYFMGTQGRLHILRDAAEFRYWSRDREVTPWEAYTEAGPIPARELPGSPTGEKQGDTAKEGLAELLECVATGRDPSSTGAHGRHALEIIAAFHLSSLEKMQPLRLPLTGKAVQLDLKFR